MPDIITAPIEDNETWNECPVCKKTWRNEERLPGILYRTLLCERCDRVLNKIKNPRRPIA